MMSLNDGDGEDSKLKSEPMRSVVRISPCEDMTNLIHLEELDLSEHAAGGFRRSLLCLLPQVI